jgi:hypothetical protein
MDGTQWKRPKGDAKDAAVALAQEQGAQEVKDAAAWLTDATKDAQVEGPKDAKDATDEPDTKDVEDVEGWSSKRKGGDTTVVSPSGGKRRKQVPASAARRESPRKRVQTVASTRGVRR